jgi:protein-S-isoprenylcysteine O-methyltransferase Ste14
MRIDLPAILIGLIIGAYWARVLKLVFKHRRESGRAANFVPPELLGRALRIIWYPTVALWIAVPFIVGFRPRSFSPEHARGLLLGLAPLGQIVAWLGVALAFACFIATLICWKRMGKSWRMGIDPNEKTQLVFTGPYAYVRHPIYALSSWMMIGSVLAVPTISMCILAIIHILFLQWEARREEKYLVQLHGPGYAEYLSHVGRFIPRSFSPYAPQS